jgi:hypothetical protein
MDPMTRAQLAYDNMAPDDRKERRADAIEAAKDEIYKMLQKDGQAVIWTNGRKVDLKAEVERKLANDYDLSREEAMLLVCDEYAEAVAYNGMTGGSAP